MHLFNSHMYRMHLGELANLLQIFRSKFRIYCISNFKILITIFLHKLINVNVIHICELYINLTLSNIYVKKNMA